MGEYQKHFEIRGKHDKKCRSCLTINKIGDEIELILEYQEIGHEMLKNKEIIKTILGFNNKFNEYCSEKNLEQISIRPDRKPEYGSKKTKLVYKFQHEISGIVLESLVKKELEENYTIVEKTKCN